MIDHNSEYDRDQGFRDATSNELREYRNEQESRYRENQIREGWKSKDAPLGSLPMSSRDRLTLTIVGERIEKQEQERRKNIPTSVSYNTMSIVDAVMITAAVFGFFLLFLKLVN